MQVHHARRAAAAIAACAIAAAAPAAAQAAIQTHSAEQGVTAAELAQALAGPGVTVSDAQLTGHAAGAGTFTGGAPVGIDQGIVLSSGRVADVAGPNDDTGAGTGFGGGGDADLDQLAGANDAEDATQDAVVLEFDAVASAPTISFRYAFGSEEYTEYVDQGYNDVFAFFVQQGEHRTNCATVPAQGGPVPVSVDTVNPQRNAALYRDNGDGQLDTQLDGLTTVLTCTATVDPGQPVHIKLAIADRGDDILDSAVALEAGSLVAGAQPTSLSARPALLSLNPLGVALFEPSATLRAATGPLAGRTVSFTVRGKGVCSATTDARGVATCSGLARLLDITLAGGYVASFAGDETLKPASARGPLIR